MVTLKYRIKKFFGYSTEEIYSLLITILILGFIVGFNDGRQGMGIDMYYILYLISSMLIVALTVLVHVSVQRIVALNAGYKIVYRVWWYGLSLSLILGFLTNGKAWLFLPGGFVALMIEKSRLGKFRYGINYGVLGFISFAGSMANILIAMFFRIISNISFLANNSLIETTILVNCLYAVYTYLFIPPLDGFNMFFATRMGYVFTLGGIIGAALLLVLKIPLLISILGSLLIAIITWGAYYWNYEK